MLFITYFEKSRRNGSVARYFWSQIEDNPFMEYPRGKFTADSLFLMYHRQQNTFYLKRG